ncbi:MAG: YmdB family metallophosphoesterase [Alphaproteobacteria bacterium]|jgi:metallophosphoesterase (TIGR00282 family)|nr:YmdB family metallophosphoesterase [Alphaproteobacteria bacterium]
MRLLYCGDVVGRPGREVVQKLIPLLIQHWALDWVVVNAENAASGFGVTPQICDDLFALGVDIIVCGNHTWDQKDIIPYIAKQPRLIRPLNYPEGTPGNGLCVLSKPTCRGQLVVAQLMGRLFMEPLDDPFVAIEKALQPYRLSHPSIGAILVDVHGEATSEKMALGHVLDGRVTAVIGTHTHVPTADCQLLPKGTAYQSDAGMCGDYDSVIGMEKEAAIARFKKRIPTPRLSPALGEASLCGTFLDIDDTTGFARSIHPVRLLGRLSSSIPPGLSSNFLSLA